MGSLIDGGRTWQPPRVEKNGDGICGIRQRILRGMITVSNQSFLPVEPEALIFLLEEHGGAGIIQGLALGNQSSGKQVYDTV